MVNRTGNSRSGKSGNSSVNQTFPLPAVKRTAPCSPLPDTLSSLIDHTLLKPEATASDVDKLCDEGNEYQFAAICVDGSWVSCCAKRLSRSNVKVCSVAGFPLGASTSESKAFETRQLVDLGAQEIDMVAPIGRILSGDWNYLSDDIHGVVEAASGNLVKVILETAVLSRDLTVRATEVAMEAGVQFVKTSTGFHPKGGATVEAIELMASTVRGKIGVKAAGGIKDCTSALRMVAAGATRVGTSSGVTIAKEAGDTPLKELLSR